ncbi:cation:proton antiporter [Oricola thermophila]|uniref:Cation:proton antiporter n=1 Tax=Oricola thermophila TaxID=2742145 RepID=A0A6N1VDQ7_9HYPH|nr:cation:proton antiporter [Oricola thermophila]QKV18673.1 cation:proton antiporter [Oricola thermophila]
MSTTQFLDFSVHVALAVLSVTFLLTVFKVIRGPTLPDRILALDMLVAVAIGFIAVIGIKTGYTLYLDIAIALGLVGFLATVAFARFILTRGRIEESDSDKPRLVTGDGNRSRASARGKQAAGEAEGRGGATTSEKAPKKVK